MFCRHHWEVISETVTKSAFEVAAEITKGNNNRCIPWQTCDTTRKHIQIVTCRKCGDLKRYVTSLN